MSQEYNFVNYDKDDIEQKYIYEIKQNTKGYMYFATEGGVLKYNGFIFEKYTTDEGLAENFVKSLFIDSKERIWAGHYQKGVSIIDGNRIIKVKTLQNRGVSVTSFTEDNTGHVFFSTDYNGIFRVDTSYEPKLFYVDSLVKTNSVFYKNSHLFVGTSNGLFFINTNGSNDSPSQILHGKEVIEILPCKSNNLLWIVTKNSGLIKYDSENNTYNVISELGFLKNISLTSACADVDSGLWVGSKNGELYNIIFKDNEKVRVNHFSKSNGLNANLISSLFVGKERNVWIGTFGSGIKILRNREYSLRTGFFKGDNAITSIEYINKNKICLSLSKSIVFLDSSFNVTNIIQLNNNYNTVTDVLFSANVLWFGTSQGAFFIDNTNKIQKINFLKNDYINSIDADSSGKIYFATNNGLVELRNGKYLRITTNEEMLHNSIKKVFVDSYNRVWIGTRQSNISYIKNEKVHILKEVSGFLNINDICEDNNGNIWFATKGEGVFSIMNDTIVRNYSIDDGLATNSVYSILVDKNNIIWTGHRNGICFKPNDSKSFISFQNSKSFLSNTINNSTIINDNAGRTLFGSENGLIVYEHTKKKNNKNINTFVVSVVINAKTYNPDNIIVVPYNKNNLVSFNYDAPYYTETSSLSFFYTLTNYDKTWKEVDYKQRSAIYSGIPSGNYTFKLITRTNTDAKQVKAADVRIIIQPPFWKTWWFNISLIVFFITIIIVIIFLRERNHKIVQKYLSEQLKLRTDELLKSKELIEQKNREMTDSIKYAQTIQEAILQSNNLNELFHESFVYYKPLDIVSGDFYWLLKTENEIIVAAVDCTGHGVPGAFMSVIGNKMLDEIVKNDKIVNPEDILKMMDIKLFENLDYSGIKSNIDGMDMSMISYNFSKGTVLYSGAASPIYLVRDNEITRFKGGSFGIGVVIEDKKYDTTEIKIQKNDIIYMCSDGYQDQFGGKNNRKLNVKRYSKLLLQASSLPISEQKVFLSDSLDSWKGDDFQTDDIMVLGIKF